jgi:tungstate transport system substrate-binding protein
VGPSSVAAEVRRSAKDRVTRRRLSRTSVVACALALAACGREGREVSIRLATTTSARDTGLLDRLLPAFRADTGVEVLAVAVGTGEALRLGERGDAEVVLVHSREAEDEFVDRGLGVARADAWWNRFAIVGPPGDPAGVARTRTAVDALRAVRDAGSRFVSRGDDSGTHRREKALWEAAGGFARWPGHDETGQGMAATLQIAEETGAYALTDEGTFLARRRGVLVPLLVGDPALRNPYGVLLVRPSGDASRDEAARRLFDWLRSDAARSLVQAFRVGGRRAFWLPEESGEDAGPPAVAPAPPRRALSFFGESVSEAGRLLAGGDPDTWHAIGLSLWTSLLAVALGGGLGALAGAAVALFRPPGRRPLVFLFRVGMSVPTVALGLVVYGFLSRRGPLGHLDLLYSPWAIVLGEVLLAFPIVAALTHAGVSALDRTAIETVRTHGGGRAEALRRGLSERRSSVVAALLVAFGRCVTELGIALVVGGNLRLRTRTLPAQTTLELSRGELGRALAPCVILVAMALLAAVAAHAVAREERR